MKKAVLIILTFISLSVSAHTLTLIGRTNNPDWPSPDGIWNGLGLFTIKYKDVIWSGYMQVSLPYKLDVPSEAISVKVNDYMGLSKGEIIFASNKDGCPLFYNTKDETYIITDIGPPKNFPMIYKTSCTVAY